MNTKLYHTNICLLHSLYYFRRSNPAFGAVPIVYHCHKKKKLNYTLINSYEEGRFVQEIKTDYVVWEKTGRMDFGYTATMSEV